MVHDTYDFEGRLTHSRRRLASEYHATPSWSALAAISDPSAVLPAAAALLETDSFATSTVFDALSHVVDETAPDGSVTSFTYDTGARLKTTTTTVHGTTAPVVTDVEYDAAGQRVKVAAGTGLVSQYTYDPRNRQTIRILTTRASDGAVLQDLQYTHDPVGNIVQVDDAAQEAVYFAGSVTTGRQQYEYDALYRLRHATGREHPGQVGYGNGGDGYPEAPVSTVPHPNNLQALVPYTEDYAYDAVGNLLSTAHAAGGSGWTRVQTLVAGTNRIATVSMPGDPVGGPYSGVFDHDAAGNAIRMPNLSVMTWDHAGHLVSASLGGGGTAYFTHDAQGNRVRKVVERGGKRLERLYVAAYERYRETALGSSIVTLERETVHVHDAGRRFVIVETKTVDASAPGTTPVPAFRFQLPNHLGSVCVETDGAGTVLSYEEYYPYGGSSFRSGDAAKCYRYAGKERDEETGLYYMGARYYVPWLGRWASADPAGFVDGPNVYRYARDNPVGLSDPNGMYPAAKPAPEAEEAAEKFLVDLAERLGIGAPAAPPAAAVVPVAAPAAATAPTVAAAPAGLVGAEALGFVQMGAVGLAILGEGALSLTRQNNIVQYGNVWGVPHPGLGILDALPRPVPQPRPRPRPHPKPDPKPDMKPDPRIDPRLRPDERDRRRKPRYGRLYVTYTKKNTISGLFYTGRTSMIVDLTKPILPQVIEAVKTRDLHHHVDEREEPKGAGFAAAKYDEWGVGTAVNYADRGKDPYYAAIRGREQQMIDYKGGDYRGGAWSDTGKPYKTENKIRGVRKDNPKGRMYHEAASFLYGELFPYTGR